MHPVLVRYRKFEGEFYRRKIAQEWRHGLGEWSISSGRYPELRARDLENVLGCPHCCLRTDLQRVAYQCIVDVLKRNGFDVHAVINQLNKGHREGMELAIVNDDGSILFYDCIKFSDILKAVAELIE